jgi:CO/xanthine dehydrogenase Mo-binding subunit
MVDRFHRADARAKVTGHAVYGVDLLAPRMLHGGVVRAGVPAGRIRRIDTSAARALPGVVVVEAADVPGGRHGMLVDDQPVLVDDRVTHPGAPVVAVAAPDEEVLRAAIGAVVVEVDPLPWVTHVEAALSDDAPPVHGDDQPFTVHVPGLIVDGNRCGRSVLESGDPEAAFTDAAIVVEDRYTTPRVHHGYIEPRSCLAEALPDGGYHVTTSTQAPFAVREALAAMLAVPESRIRVSASTVGGGFGGKQHVTFEHWACLLARASGRPVKFTSSREEELIDAMPREDAVVFIRSALDAGGTLIGRQVRCLLNAGAYATDTPLLASVATMQATGPYRIPSVRSVAEAVYTSTQPTGACRGPSGPQMILAVEAHMDHIADVLGVDRVELRRRHLFTDGDRACNGQELGQVAMGACLERALDAIGYGRPLPKGHGIGLACAWWFTAGGPAGATVRVEADGAISVATGGTEIGTGAVAAGVVHLVAQELGVPPDRVRVAASGDTAHGAHDLGAIGSRTTFNVGQAARRAVEDVRGQLLAHAGAMLEADPRDLELDDGTIRVVGAPDTAVDLAAVASYAIWNSGPIHASARFSAPEIAYDRSCVPSPHLMPAFRMPSYHCHAVEVAVDPDTGSVRVVRYVAVHDVGRAIVPAAIEGQVHGGVLQGIGLALHEEIRTEDGQVVERGLEDYKLPTAMEAPPIETIIVEQGSGSDATAPKGIGEPPAMLPPAAITNAVAAATGRTWHDLPLTPERLLGLRDR